MSRRRRLTANDRELRATSEVSRSSVPAKIAKPAEERRRWGDDSGDQPALSPSTHSSGAVRPVRLNVYWSGSQEPWRFTFDQPSLLLGRAAGADLQLAHKSVSPRHAYLQRIGHRVLCIDLGSGTGTLWNGSERLRDWLTPGDRISIGPYQIEMACPPATTEPDTAVLTEGTASGQRVLLRVLKPALRRNQPALWPLREHVTLIGRGPDCDIRVGHASISRVHCALVADQDGVWVRDLLSESGTLVGGQPVQYARLLAGDDLQIGKVVFRIVIPAVPAPPPPGIVRAETAGGPSREEPASSLSILRPLPLARGGLQESGVTSTAHLPEELITAILSRLVGVQNTQVAEFVATITDVQRQYLEQLRNELNEVRELKDELSAIRKELHASRNLPVATVPPASAADQDHRAPTSDGVPALTDGPSRDPDATRQHEWIMQRLAQIESEKTGRWKTVLQAQTRPNSGRN